MMQILEAHWLTIFTVMLAFLATSVFWFNILPIKKAYKMACFTTLWNTLTFTALLFDGFGRFCNNTKAALLVANFLAPFLMVGLCKSWFYGLELRRIISWNFFRFFGAALILEMTLGRFPKYFCLACGVGNVVVATLALLLFFSFPKRTPRWGVIALAAVGITEATATLFVVLNNYLKFVSFAGSKVLFPLHLFPLGIIIMILSSFSICKHIISLFNLPMHE